MGVGDTSSHGVCCVPGISGATGWSGECGLPEQPLPAAVLSFGGFRAVRGEVSQGCESSLLWVGPTAKVQEIAE